MTSEQSNVLLFRIAFYSQLLASSVRDLLESLFVTCCRPFCDLKNHAGTYNTGGPEQK